MFFRLFIEIFLRRFAPRQLETRVGRGPFRGDGQPLLCSTVGSRAIAGEQNPPSITHPSEWESSFDGPGRFPCPKRRQICECLLANYRST
jgi:hypothetical protein